jgi:quercetin dioxygenase-like cupin family protein
MALKHAKSGEVVGLGPLGSGLKDSKTSAIIKSEHFEAIRLVLPAGTKIPLHEVAGNVTLHCLEGHVTLGLTGAALDLKAADWVYLDPGEPHSITGIEDSSLLMTILFPRRVGPIPGL